MATDSHNVQPAWNSTCGAPPSAPRELLAAHPDHGGRGEHVELDQAELPGDGHVDAEGGAGGEQPEGDRQRHPGAHAARPATSQQPQRHRADQGCAEGRPTARPSGRDISSVPPGWSGTISPASPSCCTTTQASTLTSVAVAAASSPARQRRVEEGAWDSGRAPEVVLTGDLLPRREGMLPNLTLQVLNAGATRSIPSATSTPNRFAS
jgi:hypothetical protein